MRFIYWALIIYFVYLVWKFIQSPRKKPVRTQPSQRPPQMMVKDETCNTYLPVEDAIKEISEGREYFFCSKDCRQKFLDRKKSGS